MTAETAVIIPVYNNSNLTLSCLDSLAAARGSFQVIVVDNGSEDIEYNKIKDKTLNKKAYPFKLTLLRNSDNLGFGAAVNRGIEAVEGESYILVLNNDTEIEPDMIAVLKDAWLNLPEAAGLCPAIAYFDKKDTVWYAGGAIKWYKKSMFKHSYMNIRIQDLPERPYETDYLTGCALFSHSAVFNNLDTVFDETFFLYFEDVDLSYRLKRLPAKLYVVPAAQMYHKVSFTTSQQGSEFSYYHHNRSYMYFIMKNFSVMLKAWVFLKILRKLSGYIIKLYSTEKRMQMKAYLRGLNDGCKLYLNHKKG